MNNKRFQRYSLQKIKFLQFVLIEKELRIMDTINPMICQKNSAFTSYLSKKQTCLNFRRFVNGNIGHKVIMHNNYIHIKSKICLNMPFERKNLLTLNNF